MSAGEAPEAAGASEARSSGAPSEEELRAAYEAELARVSSTDMIAQATVSLLNIGALRLGPAGGSEGREAQAAADLEQARDSIDAARALLEILERRIPSEVRSLRDALAQLQMVYARAVQAAATSSQEPGAGGAAEEGGGPEEGERKETGGGSGAAGGGSGAGGGTAGGPAPEGGEGERRPGPAESSGRLWVPGS